MSRFTAPFIERDEHIILMHDPQGGRCTHDDLVRLREIGVKTVMEYISWADTEVADFHYDWSKAFAAIERARRAGMKVLLAVTCDYAPRWFDKDFYLHSEDGEIFKGWCYDHVMSPWCSAGVGRQLDFLERVTSYLSADDVCCYRATCHGGETMLPDSGSALHDPWAIADFEPYRSRYETAEAFIRWINDTTRKMMLREQAIFYRIRNELWTALHYAFASQIYTGNSDIPGLYAAMYKQFPEMVHYGICFTYFQNVGGKVETIRDVRDGKVKMFVGSEYCEGLLHNTIEAIMLGFRGFVTAPLHGWSGKTSMEPWMFDAFAQSLNEWRKANAVHQG